MSERNPEQTPKEVRMSTEQEEFAALLERATDGNTGPDIVVLNPAEQATVDAILNNQN